MLRNTLYREASEFPARSPPASGDARFRPTVLVVRKLTVLLDDVAFAGLTRTAYSLGKTHQETARLLLERAGRG